MAESDRRPTAQEIEELIDLVRRDLTKGRHDAREHLVAGTVPPLAQPPVEVHWREQGARDDERKTQHGRAKVLATYFDVLIFREDLPEIRHHRDEARPVDALVLARERGERHGGSGDHEIDGHLLVAQRAEENLGAGRAHRSGRLNPRGTGGSDPRGDLLRRALRAEGR